MWLGDGNGSGNGKAGRLSEKLAAFEVVFERKSLLGVRNHGKIRPFHSRGLGTERVGAPPRRNSKIHKRSKLPKLRSNWSA